MSMNRKQGKQEKQSRHELMTKTPVPKLISKLAVPTIISMLVTAFYNMADTFFVGQISTEATAAVGLVFSVMAVIQALGFFCGHGSGNYLSRMLGAGKQKEANDMASTGFVLALLLGTMLAVLGNLCLHSLVLALGAKGEMIQDTENYLRIILIGAPFTMGQFVVNNQLRFQGSAMYAMIGLMCGAVINVGLDPLLIFGFHMGVSGAAIATVMGQVVSFVVLLVGSRKGENIRLHIKNVHLNRHYLFEILNGGAPSLLRQGMTAISTILLNRYAGIYGGPAAIAGMSIVTRVMMLLASALIGFGQGYQPVCSYNYGAGFKQRVREGYFFCVKWGTVFLSLLSILCLCFASQIIGFFRNDAAVIEVGALALRCQAAALPVVPTIVISNMMLQSMGKGLEASITASARNGICFIPLILILPACFGLVGVQISQACADVLSLSITLPFAIRELKKLR